MSEDFFGRLCLTGLACVVPATYPTYHDSNVWLVRAVRLARVIAVACFLCGVVGLIWTVRVR